MALECLKPVVSSQKTIIVWFRQDLRLTDHVALSTACREAERVLPVYIHSPESEGAWPIGSASQWWLHFALQDLQAQLRAKGSDLLLFLGSPVEILERLATETGAAAVYFSRRYEPAAKEVEKKLNGQLHKKNVTIKGFSGSLLFEPEDISNRQGLPFKVFTPFWRHCQTVAELSLSVCLPAPSLPLLPKISTLLLNQSLTLKQLNLLPSVAWDAGLKKNWEPTRKGAEKMLQTFLAEALSAYELGRDNPGVSGTSKLSPYLHFGQLSPREVFQAASATGPKHNAAETFLRQLGWREFSAHLLAHFPNAAAQPLRPEFERFRWETRYEPLLKRWQQGRTGYPIVDAGMRELWETGWMHNRVRMIAASFLVKDLLIPWQEGARWFWDTLVDADLANNTMGWQWVAGCGVDAAPYFRIFNPVLQGEKFDPKGVYIRRWLPELKDFPDKYIHKPWLAPEKTMSMMGFQFGQTYPAPIVDHAEARQRALTAFKNLK